MLTELPFDKINELCSILKGEWPASIFAVYFLQSCAERKKKDPNFEVVIYYSATNFQSAAFVSVLKSGCVMPFVTMYALHSYEDELEKMLLHLSINWNEQILFKIPKKFSPLIEKLVVSNSCRVLDLTEIKIFSLVDLKIAKNLEVNDSGDVEIRKLSMEHLKEVYQLWHMQHIHTINELEDAFQLNAEFALGLFCKKTDLLLGWCLRAAFGGIGFLHVKAEARGKGYARLLVAQITKKLAEFSIEPFTLIRNSNEGSIRVFTAVGFHRVSQISRFLICK